MTSKTLAFFCAMFLAFFATPGMCGAFGIEFGTPINKLKVLRIVADGAFAVAAPQPNAGFDGYMVFASAKLGVCKIVGEGKNHDNDAAGLDVRSDFDGLQTKLDAKYGPSKKYDFSHAGNIWTGPAEFSMALKTNSYTLAAAWEADKDPKFPANLANILLEAKALSSSTTYVSLQYEAKNFKACLDEVNAKGDAAL